MIKKFKLKKNIENLKLLLPKNEFQNINFISFGPESN